MHATCCGGLWEACSTERLQTRCRRLTLQPSGSAPQCSSMHWKRRSQTHDRTAQQPWRSSKASSASSGKHAVSVQLSLNSATSSRHVPLTLQPPHKDISTQTSVTVILRLILKRTQGDHMCADYFPPTEHCRFLCRFYAAFAGADMKIDASHSLH
jgi:hypothetical protein